MNSNIIKIGKALKWRGVYDDSKKYYAENIVTCYGGMFRCNVQVAQGIPPYQQNENGLPTIQNSETWTCLVDTTWIIEWVLAFRKFKDDAIARFESNEKHIDEHCKKLDEQQKGISSLGNSVNKLAQKDTEHDSALSRLSKELDSTNGKVSKNEQSITDLEMRLAESERQAVLLEEQLQNTNERITNVILNLNQIITSQNEKISKNEEDIKRLGEQIKELQEQIELISKYNCCFSTGFWDNNLTWDNDGYWNNGSDGGDDNEEIQPEIGVLGYVEKEGELMMSGSVISYNEESGTLSIVDETNTYDESTGTLHIDGA